MAALFFVIVFFIYDDINSTRLVKVLKQQVCLPFNFRYFNVFFVVYFP